MPGSVFAVLLVLVSSVVAFGQNETEWIKFTPPEKSFSLLLPREPDLVEIPGPIKHNRYNRFEKGYGFVIEYFDNMQIMSPEQFLDETRDGIVGVVNGKLTREIKISLDGLPGRQLEFTHDVKNGVEVFSRVRFYYGKGRLYSMSYIWRKDMDPALVSSINDKYFSSIRIMPVK